MNGPRALALAALAALAALPWVLARHQLSILTDLLIFGLFALSLDLIMGYTGMVSFGHAAYFGLGAYGSALVLVHSGQPVPVALLAGALLAGVVALPVGWFSTRATGIYFAMLTLAFAQLLYTVAYKWRDLTGGSDGLAGVPKTTLFWGGPSLATPHAYYFLVTACVVLALLLCRALVRSPFGRALQAIRENERRFVALGRAARPFKLVVFVIAAALAGLAGALFAPFRGFASPEVMFWVLSGQGLMMVLTGGIGTLIGPILGAMVFILIQEVLSSYTEHWMIFSGAVFVLMVIFLPGGLVGTARRLVTRA
ncbi:MAG: branched-chain amino acid ABC transporter permease [Candidatus Rokubacteria bacterium]|nr:branched-chain amino acid ABC transporter permease [Candidatus Rokubacteria bacterium]MBI2156601.1 branched-chain amino acid ABC transporter permease [Candidatus Rokubacteria bacterium]MBI2493547.1 branched-chain amino acid ABC transporter permease [Candidatus Rokubacteria bacterium]MBI4255933.1 branched-chain amino acid ABC transporter permease [Candidatus Rokubacteria bacterium]